MSQSRPQVEIEGDRLSLPYREVWVVDFEFRAPDGERPEPVCMVARELRGGTHFELWADELRTCTRPPFDLGSDTLFVAYYASAELSCFLALGWPMPARILDLFAEFRVASNGRPAGAGGASLIGAALWHGLDAMAADEKAEMRALVLRGGPYTSGERVAILDYCRSDVDMLAALLPRMLPELLGRQRLASLALGQALLRGRYMAAAARMEWTGIPIDAELLGHIRSAWAGIKRALVAELDNRFGIYDGLTFKTDRFAAYLAAHDIPWPRLESGTLALDDDTFRDMARSYPQLQVLRELRHALGELRLEALAVGRDGRNRCLLSAFRSRTGRNQPSNTRFVFGPATWVRSLIRPGPGQALAYVDFSSQEMGIAAALSDDGALLEAYLSGDIYLSFAKRAGLAPLDATKATHGDLRDRCKAVVLGTLYGMGPDSLARRIGRPPCEARELLRLHKESYPRFWRWSDETVASAVLNGRIETVFGWQLHVGAEFNPRSLMNYPMQANGAEMMRLAASLATERGLAVCAPVHDAFLIEAPAETMDGAVEELQECMREASRVVLGGLDLGSDAVVVHWPERYRDKRGAIMWETITRLVSQLGSTDSRNAAVQAA